MREGSHVVEMEMKGTLHGLPVGPVEIRGRAAGSVLVRNPAFSLTFTHPEVVTAGEPYTLDVTVTNTSESPANFVSLNLYPRNVSGATIVGANTREIESVLPGDSATVTFDLVSNITGAVTAATLDSNENVKPIRTKLRSASSACRCRLTRWCRRNVVAAQERPRRHDRTAGQGVGGRDRAGGALPADVQRFSKKIVIDRAVEVAEAGFRVAARAARRQRRAPGDGRRRQQDTGALAATRRSRVRAEPSRFDALRRQSWRSLRGRRRRGLADALASKAPWSSTSSPAAGRTGRRTCRRS
jgi:hypothetical protein